MGAFHAYDIRGVYNKDFDKNIVYKVGYFIPRLLEVDKVLIGRDARTSSPEIHEYLIKGITDAGADVYDLGLATTPLVYYSTAVKGFGASVQITASHNSKEYNGLKVSRENAMPVGYDTGLSTIETWINQGLPCEPKTNKGKVINLEMYNDYFEFLQEYKGDYSNLNISVDISNGMAELFIEKILGDSPKYLNNILDGTFPGHDPNPLVPANTADIKKMVAENRSDVGLIFDGDADRVMFIDENSNFVSPDLIIALLGHFFLEGKGASPKALEYAKTLNSLENSCHSNGTIKVLQDIRTSKAVKEYLGKMGAEVETWRVGRAFAAPKLREINGLFGGELAGHYYFKDFFYSDSGILAALIVLDVVSYMKKEGISFSKLISNIEKYHNSGEINFKIEKKQEAMDAVKAYFTKVEEPTVEIDFDGYRVEFPQWWFNIRPSNTEPYLRFICEASSMELLEEKIKIVRNIIEDLT